MTNRNKRRAEGARSSERKHSQSKGTQHSVETVSDHQIQQISDELVACGGRGLSKRLADATLAVDRDDHSRFALTEQQAMSSEPAPDIAKFLAKLQRVANGNDTF